MEMREGVVEPAKGKLLVMFDLFLSLFFSPCVCVFEKTLFGLIFNT